MGLSPLYDLLLTMLAGAPAFLPSRQGRRQGGTEPLSRALMIWLVMAWRMSFWFGMTDSKVIVGFNDSFDGVSCLRRSGENEMRPGEVRPCARSGTSVPE